MFQKSTFVALALFFSSAISLPTADVVDQTDAPLSYPAEPVGYGNISNYLTVGEKRDIEKRNNGGVYITVDAQWQGTNGYAQQPWDTCIGLDSPWWHSISSLGPDSGNAVVLSQDYYCSAPHATIWYPGNADLTSIGWNDAAGSFIVRQVAVVSGRQCVYSVFPGITCTSCCNGCDRSGTDCCPSGYIC